MREFTPEQKTKFIIYKETEEYTFPEDRVWKIWVPRPKTMPGGYWLQFPTQEEALSVALMTKEEWSKYEAELWNDGGW